jgi:hypothetical protein
LTAEQQLWLTAQILMDQGYRLCETCGAMQSTPYCGACGASMQGDSRPPLECVKCKAISASAYCPQCGTILYNKTMEELDAGIFDWEALETKLKKFTGGITAAEEAALLQTLT